MRTIDELLTQPLRTWLVVAHLAATLFMTGLIWFVQIVHYPLFARVGSESFIKYQHQHMRRTTWVVVVPMLIELMLAASLAVMVRGAVAYAGLALVIVIWVSTWLWQVPAHQTLVSGFDAAAHRTLVRSNWARTAGWSLRSAIAISLLLDVR